MKTQITLWLTALLSFAAISTSSAMTEIFDVSPEKAKEIGATMTSRKNGSAGTLLTLQFKRKGTFKEFRLGELRITKAKKHLLSARLLTSTPTKDTVSVSFSVDPTYLADCELWIYVDDIPLGGSAYRFKVKDFLPQLKTEQARKASSANDKTSKPYHHLIQEFTQKKQQQKDPD